MTSQETAHSSQVLVVGSGPAGLVAALSLLKNGISVRVVEKDAEHHTGERGPGVQESDPRSLELEHFMGIDEVAETGITVDNLNIMDPNDPYRVAREQVFLEPVQPTPTMPITRGVLLGQSFHQAILRKHVEALGGSVELGTELIALEETDKGIRTTLKKSVEGMVIEETSVFVYLVGADGARSTVRKCLGIDFVGRTEQDMTAYIVDAFVEGFDLPGLTLFGRRGGDGVFFRQTTIPKLYCIILSNEERNFDRLLPVENNKRRIEQEIARITKRDDIHLDEIRWQNLWVANIRMASTFRKGRAFIVGDAAHTHSPAGGQGLNTSISDSYNLAWKIALVLKGMAKPEILDSYTAERMPVIAHMLDLTTELYKLKETVSSEVPEDEKPQSQKVRSLGSKEFLQLFINYRWSDVVYDERFVDRKAEVNPYGVDGEAVRAGDRAPDAPSLECLFIRDGLKEVSRLFDLFSPTQHIALVFQHGSPDASTALLSTLTAFPKDSLLKVILLPATGELDFSIFSGVDYVLRDSENHAHTGYGVDNASLSPIVVIVRPDAQVGAFAVTASGVERYSSLIFN